MKLHDYLKDKGSVLLVNAAGLFFLSLFLRLSAVRTAVSYTHLTLPTICSV